MIRRLVYLLAIGSVVSCAAEPESEPNFCRGTTRHLYDPNSAALLAWPDDALAQEAETSTGLRLTNDVPWMKSMPPTIQDMLASIAGPTGFARQGAALLRFSAHAGLYPGIWEEPSIEGPLLLLSWQDGDPELVPFALEVDDEGRQIRLQPLRPLRAASPHAVILKATHLADDGECISPSGLLRHILSDEYSATEPQLARVARQIHEALDVLGLRPEDVSAALTFTTHDDVALVAEIAGKLNESPPTWVSRPSCEPDGDRRRCTGVFLAGDFRSEGAVETSTAQDNWEVPITIWLPENEESVSPLVMYGHGLGSSRSEGRSAARRLVPYGIAVASVDALHHGDHPTASDDDSEVLDFLGIDLSGPTIDGRSLRGSFVQTALDRHQATLLLRADPDVDGDGTPDLDPERFAYWGISLGAMIGSIQLAISEHFDAGVLTLAGGYLTEFALGGVGGILLRDLLLELLDYDEAALKRTLLAVQTLADPADPAVFGAHIRDERLLGGNAPHLLMPVALHDEIVPPATGRAIARALRLPHAEPIFDPVPLLPNAGPLPLIGNAGDHTAAFLQFDTVGDPPEQAGHANTGQASEVRELSRHFFDTWAQTGEAEIRELP